MKEPDLTFLSHSLLIHPATPPAEEADLITPEEEAEEAALFNNTRATLRSKNAKIRALDSQLHHQTSIANALNDTFTGMQSDLDQKDKELEQSKGYNKELRLKFSELSTERNLKEAENSGFKETIQRLERELKEANESLSAGKGLAKTVDILKNELRLQKARVASLNTEVELLGKAKKDRDVVVNGLKKEKELWESEKNTLVKERDEIKDGKQVLEGKVRGLEELVTQRECTMDDRLKEIEKRDSDLRHIRDDRDHYKAHANRIEDDNDNLEVQVQGLKRKLDNGAVALRAPTARPAKRCRTPQSANRDRIPTGPRAMANRSPDSQRSASICSPTYGRHVQVSANEVRMRKSSQHRTYSKRR